MPPCPRQLGDLAEAAGARALKLRTAAEDCEAGARREMEAIEGAIREESRLTAVAVAAKAAREAAIAAAEEEKAQRERAEAARDAREAVEKARAAEQAAAEAAQAAIAAVAAARQATADAVAVAEARAVDRADDSKVRSESSAGGGEVPAVDGLRERESIPAVAPAAWGAVRGAGEQAASGAMAAPPAVIPAMPPAVTPATPPAVTPATPPAVTPAAVEGAVSVSGEAADVTKRPTLEEGLSMAAGSGEVRGGDGSDAP